MSRIRSLLGLIWVIPGVVFVAIAIPLARGEIEPNSVYGFRTVKSLSDSRIWYEINRVHGNDLVIAGIVMVVASLVLFVVRKWFSVFKLVILNLVIMVAALSIVLAHTVWVLSRM